MDAETRRQPPHSEALRRGRWSLRSAVYLVTAVTDVRRRHFADPALADIVADAFRHYHARGHVHGYAWVVMPDHIHWLLQLRVGTLAWLMRAFKTWTSTQVRRAMHEPPHRVWQPGYHDRQVRQHERLDHYIHYLVGNPLRWSLAKHPKDYPHLYAEAEIMDTFGAEPKLIEEKPWK